MRRSFTSVPMIFFLAAAFPFTIVFAACKTTVENRDIGEILPNEEIRLQKMRTVASQTVSVEGSWFLFGSVSANAEARVYFSWTLRDGSYAISSLPIERIRVRTVESVDNPTIRFELMPICMAGQFGARRLDTLQEGIDVCVAYATVTCAAKDWQPSVQMPLK